VLRKRECLRRPRWSLLRLAAGRSCGRSQITAGRGKSSTPLKPTYFQHRWPRASAAMGGGARPRGGA
jgi:hypothetical protein